MMARLPGPSPSSLPQSIATAMDSTATALTTSIGSVSDSVGVSISRTRTAVDAQ